MSKYSVADLNYAAHIYELISNEKRLYEKYELKRILYEKINKIKQPPKAGIYNSYFDYRLKSCVKNKKYHFVNSFSNPDHIDKYTNNTIGQQGVLIVLHDCTEHIGYKVEKIGCFKLYIPIFSEPDIAEVLYDGTELFDKYIQLEQERIWKP